MLLDNILPALEHLDPRLPPTALLSSAVEANVLWTLQQVRESPEARQRQAAGADVKMLGAIYDINTGRVRFLD